MRKRPWNGFPRNDDGPSAYRNCVAIQGPLPWRERAASGSSPVRGTATQSGGVDPLFQAALGRLRRHHVGMFPGDGVAERARFLHDQKR